MGADFSVAVNAANWPTMQSLQTCIEQRGWPVVVAKEGHPNWTKPLEGTPRTLGLPVTFKGTPMELEASFVTLSPTQSFAYSFDGQLGEEPRPVDINEKLREIGASGVRFENGDRVVTLTFRSSVQEWKAGFYVLAAVIQCAGGYGFEFQTGRHGTSDFADDLLKGAADDGWE